MKTARLLIGVVAGVLSTQMAAAQPQGDPRRTESLPSAPASGCHPLNYSYSTVGRTRESWSRTLDDMTRYGMNVTAEERALILEYLATSLGP
jgi:hypothetical protein